MLSHANNPINLLVKGAHTGVLLSNSRQFGNRVRQGQQLLKISLSLHDEGRVD